MYCTLGYKSIHIISLFLIASGVWVIYSKKNNSSNSKNIVLSPIVN